MGTEITLKVSVDDGGAVTAEVLDHVRDTPPPPAPEGPEATPGQITIDEVEAEAEAVTAGEEDVVQFALTLDDERVEGNGSAEAVALRKDLAEELSYFGEVQDLGRKGARVDPEVRREVHARAGTFTESWPAYLLTKPDGEQVFVVPVARAPKNDRPGREWRVGWGAYRMHCALDEVAKGRVLYVFKDRTAVYRDELQTGLNLVETNRGNTPHIAIAPNQKKLQEVLA